MIKLERLMYPFEARPQPSLLSWNIFLFRKHFVHLQQDLSIVFIIVSAPIMADKKKLGFAENFMLSGVAAAVSKTAAAPIERVKLLVQNQVSPDCLITTLLFYLLF